MEQHLKRTEEPLSIFEFLDPLNFQSLTDALSLPGTYTADLDLI